MSTKLNFLQIKSNRLFIPQRFREKINIPVGRALNMKIYSPSYVKLGLA